MRENLLRLIMMGLQRYALFGLSHSNFVFMLLVGNITTASHPFNNQFCNIDFGEHIVSRCV